MPKFIVTSDIHLHPWKAFASGSGINNSRFKHTLNVIRDVLETAKKYNAAWIDAGDIIHTTGTVQHTVSSALIDLLNQYPTVHKFVIWGNHDSRSKGGKVTLHDSYQHTLLNSVENLTVLDESHAVFKGITLYGCGAQPSVDLLAHSNADIGVFHGFVKGAKLPSGVTLSDGIPQEELFKHYRLSIVGDIHTPHLQEQDGRYILIPGSPEQHSFGDSGDRGYYIVDIDEHSIKILPVETNSPKFITVNTVKDIVNDGNYYRVINSTQKEDIPEGVAVVAPSPDIVTQRNTIKFSDGIDSILSTWLSLNPPEQDNDEYLTIGKRLLSDKEVTIPQGHRLVRVHGKNFYSYKDFSYEIKPGVTLVIGQSDRYNSNGCGKSSLFESVYWCLLGKTTKGSMADEVIHRGEKSASVACEIRLVSGQTLVLTRERGSALALSAQLDGEPINASTNKELEEHILGLLGLNDKLFKALAYFSQEDVTLLSRSTDAEIKEIVADLSGLSGFQTAASKATSEADVYEKQLNVLDAKRSTIQTQLYSITEDLANLSKKRIAWEEQTQQKIDNLDKELVHLHSQLSYWTNRTNVLLFTKNRAKALYQRAVDGSKSILDHKKNEYYTAAYTKRQAGIEALRKEYVAIVKPGKTKEQLTEKRIKLEKEQDDITTQLTNIKERTSMLTSIKKEVADLETKRVALSKGICPECGQPEPNSVKLLHELDQKRLPRIEEVNQLSIEVEEMKALTSTFVSRKVEIATELSQIQNDLTALDKLKALEDKITWGEKEAETSSQEEALQLATKDVSFLLKKREKQLNDRITSVENSIITKIRTAKEGISRVNSLRTAAISEENPYKSLEASALTKRNTLEKEEQDIITTRSTVLKHINIYKYWSKGLGKSGIQSLLMDELAGSFNKLRGKILPVLTNGTYDVQFTTQTSTRTGELREKLSFIVLENGKEVPFSGLSGGERRRVDLGVLLTLSAAVSASYGISGLLGIMVLDEVASFLDEDGAEALAETLKEYVTFAVPTVFLVDHSPNLQSLFDKVMIVKRNNGVSYVN